MRESGEEVEEEEEEEEEKEEEELEQLEQRLILCLYSAQEEMKGQAKG